VGAAIAAASHEAGPHRFSERFLSTEWAQVVDAWQLDSWESHRDVARLGRKTRLPEAQRATLWAIFQRVRQELTARGLVTQAGMFRRLERRFVEGAPLFFDHLIVDEAQDLDVAQLRFLAASGAGRPNALFSLATSDSASFSSPSRGSRSASTSGGGRAHSR
jgi:hypothetical protein